VGICQEGPGASGWIIAASSCWSGRAAGRFIIFLTRGQTFHPKKKCILGLGPRCGPKPKTQNPKKMDTHTQNQTQTPKIFWVPKNFFMIIHSFFLIKNMIYTVFSQFFALFSDFI
jgi:hypothetical protein